jgi:hypothetical protein
VALDARHVSQQRDAFEPARARMLVAAGTDRALDRDRVVPRRSHQRRDRDERLHQARYRGQQRAVERSGTRGHRAGRVERQQANRLVGAITALRFGGGGVAFGRHCVSLRQALGRVGDLVQRFVQIHAGVVDELRAPSGRDAIEGRASREQVVHREQRAALVVCLPVHGRQREVVPGALVVVHAGRERGDPAPVRDRAAPYVADDDLVGEQLGQRGIRRCRVAVRLREL